MYTVWKDILLNSFEVQEVQLPKDAEFLCVQNQRESACIWYRCEPVLPLKVTTRKFQIVGTGHDCPSPEEGKYLGTFQTANGGLIWHLFERID